MGKLALLFWVPKELADDDLEEGLAVADCEPFESLEQIHLWLKEKAIPSIRYYVADLQAL